MSTTLREQANATVVAPVSFETGRLGAYRVPFSYTCEVLKITSRVTQVLGATNAGTITAATVDGPVGNGVITHAAAAPFGDEQSVSPTTGRKVNKGSYLELTTAKTTAGGQAIVTIHVLRKHY